MKKALSILLALAALDLRNNPDQEWTCSADADAWTLSVVTAVAKPVIESDAGVSVCVPGAYVTGIADVTASTAAQAVKGSQVIDYGQENYVFGDSDARHRSTWVLKALQDNHDTLEPLFDK